MRYQDDSDISVILDSLGSRPIAFHVAYARASGSIAAGLMLSQAMYWSYRTKDPDGWFWKTIEEWEEETGLRRSEQERARKALTSLGAMEVQRRGIPARLFFRVNKDGVAKMLTGSLGPMDAERILEIFGPTLNSLSKTAYMRGKRAGVEASFVDYRDLVRTRDLVCHICNEPIVYGPGNRDGALVFDHIVAINNGGSHTEDNIGIAHAKCNRLKSDNDDYTSETSLSSQDIQGSLVESFMDDLEPQTITENTQRPQKKITNTPASTTPTWEQRFDRWYSTYPRKQAKGDAKKAWQKINPDDALVAEMVAAVERQKRTHDWQKDGGKYIPLPASWLRAERWLDEVGDVAPSSAPGVPRYAEVADPYEAQMQAYLRKLEEGEE